MSVTKLQDVAGWPKTIWTLACKTPEDQVKLVYSPAEPGAKPVLQVSSEHTKGADIYLILAAFTPAARWLPVILAGSLDAELTAGEREELTRAQQENDGEFTAYIRYDQGAWRIERIV